MGANAVGTGNIVGGAVTESKIGDNAVSLAKMAHGTGGKFIGYSPTGAPAELDEPQGVNFRRVFSSNIDFVINSRWVATGYTPTSDINVLVFYYWQSGGKFAGYLGQIPVRLLNEIPAGTASGVSSSGSFTVSRNTIVGTFLVSRTSTGEVLVAATTLNRDPTPMQIYAF